MTRYRRKKRRTPLGWPEGVAFILLCLTVVSFVIFWMADDAPEFGMTTGRVLQAAVERSHYNATTYESLVDLAYEYSVNGMPFRGAWKGFWPMSESPNALSKDTIYELKSPDHVLTIYYDLNNPAISSLHATPVVWRKAFVSVPVALVIFTLFYCARFYPKWRRRASRYY